VFSKEIENPQTCDELMYNARVRRLKNSKQIAKSSDTVFWLLVAGWCIAVVIRLSQMLF
jgi:hypothetical protein